MLKQLLIIFVFVIFAGCDQSSTTQTSDQSSNTGNSNADTNIYSGENVNYIVTTNPGGGYDAYARLIAKYLVKYLGADNVIINNIPGAGHIVGTNTLWKSKPDGFTLGTFNAGLIYNQIIHRSTLQFDIGKFSWIGKAAGEPRSLVVAAQCPYETFDDLMAAEEVIKVASAGIGAASYADTKLLAEAFDLNVDIIPGFEGNEGEMSMMRGEVCAQFGTTSSTQPFVDSGGGHFVLSVGGDIEGVPRATEYAKTDKAKSIISLMSALTQLGRVTAAPPGMDPVLLEKIRAAYKSALEDPELLAEAEMMKLPIEPTFGDDVTQLVLNALNQTPETEAIISQAVNPAQ
jgi:tripartite-type tricarboxylate transporter receptor subunit TctC